jgi:dolichyl-phosphate beta-glucosyltransferase
MSRAIIVIPCYNEALRLDVRKFLAFAREDRLQRFLFVDDGSTDGTPEVLEGLRRSNPESFSVCSLPTNVGKAEAVRRGLLRALEDGAEYVGYWDADLATPLEATVSFRTLLDSRSDVDVVLGARVSLLGRCIERNPLRHYLGRLFATAASLALGVGLYDTQCGAKLFRASPEVAALFQVPFRTNWIFDVEILARLIADRRGTDRPQIEETLYEFPLHEWRDVAGSKVGPIDFLKSLFGLLDICWYYGRNATPASPNRAVPISSGPTRTRRRRRSELLGETGDAHLSILPTSGQDGSY